MKNHTCLHNEITKSDVKYTWRVLMFALCIFAFSTSVVAQRHQFPSSSWGVGAQINLYSNDLYPVQEVGIAGHYEKNLRSWFSYRYTLALEKSTTKRRNISYINLVLNPVALFRITGDNGLTISVGGHFRLINQIGYSHFHERYYFNPFMIIGPAFAIGGRMRKNKKDYGAIELMLLTNPIKLEKSFRKNPYVLQINYHFPLKLN